MWKMNSPFTTCKKSDYQYKTDLIQFNDNSIVIDGSDGIERINILRFST